MSLIELHKFVLVIYLIQKGLNWFWIRWPKWSDLMLDWWIKEEFLTYEGSRWNYESIFWDLLKRTKKVSDQSRISFQIFLTYSLERFALNLLHRDQNLSVWPLHLKFSHEVYVLCCLIYIYTNIYMHCLFTTYSFNKFAFRYHMLFKKLKINSCNLKSYV